MYIKFKIGDKVIIDNQIGEVVSICITKDGIYYNVNIEDSIKFIKEDRLVQYKTDYSNTIKEAEIEITVSTICPNCNHYIDYYEELGSNVTEHVGEVFDVKCMACGCNYKIKIVKSNN